MTVRVYAGHGSSQTGSKVLIEEFARNSINAAPIDSTEIRAGKEWRKGTSSLVFAGKSVGGFKDALGDKALNDLGSNLREGRFNYIGICAGAALASDKIKYRVAESRNTDVETIRKEGLSFFNGLASGPCRDIYDMPFTGDSANLSLITVSSTMDYKPRSVFYWGGPALVPYEKEDPAQRQVLSYLRQYSTVMGLRQRVGEGTATLYAYHPEITRENIFVWANPANMQKHESERLQRLSQNLSSDNFARFLHETGLKLLEPVKKAADYTAAFR